MNKISILKYSILTVALTLASNTVLAADVGVSISVGQPGFYGRVDIGEYPYPQPRVIYSEPIIVHRHVVEEYEPIYLRVPPGHAKRWSQYCDRYDACDRPVYFVQERWYRDDYVPHYREYHDRNYEYRDNEDHDRNREYRDNEDHDRNREYRDRDNGDNGRGHKDHEHGNGNNKHKHDRD